MATALPHFPPFLITTEEGCAGTRWKKWISKFETMITALGITNTTRKRALLLHYAGDEVFDLVDTMTEEQKGDSTNYDKLKQALSSHFEPKKNLTYETFKFRQMNQLEGESVEQFCTRLRKQLSLCEFDNPDRELVNQIVQTCRSSRLRRKALRDNLDLQGILNS